MSLQLYNSLTKQVQEFNPLSAQQVKMYTCGPTVYSYTTIGNFRTYALSDFIVRIFKYNGYNVKHIMNLTDVGHLTGDNAGDADSGEDRLDPIDLNQFACGRRTEGQGQSVEGSAHHLVHGPL